MLNEHEESGNAGDPSCVASHLTRKRAEETESPCLASSHLCGDLERGLRMGRQRTRAEQANYAGIEARPFGSLGVQKTERNWAWR